ncbi:MAG TPA: VTT domain-containing protein [Planctomycetota bacterium]
MAEALALIAAHGPLILFLIILADQSGLPVPMEPFLLGAGALMAEGRLAPVPAALSLLAAGFLGNLSWYLLGRRFGGRLLGFVCRVALEPDSCVKRTENLFTRHGVKSLLVSKFVPGLDVLGPPLAGAFGVPAGRFIAFDLGGLAIWLGAYVGLGALAHNQLEAVAGLFARFGTGAVWIVGGALVLYLAAKYLQRVRVRRRLRTSRITAAELKALIDGAAAPVVVDLRHRLAGRERPVIIPGALVLSPDEVAARHGEIARDRDVILYCA